MGLGFFWATRAYSIYIASTMGFLLQLEELPPQWSTTEETACRRLFPGPWKWICPVDLHSVAKELGFAAEIPDMKTVSIAAKIRVLHREANGTMGRRIRQLRLDIETALGRAEGEATVRVGRWN